MVHGSPSWTLCAQASMEAWRALSTQEATPTQEFSRVNTQEWIRLGFFRLIYEGLTFTLGWSLHVQTLPYVAIYLKSYFLGLNGSFWSPESPRKYKLNQTQNNMSQYTDQYPLGPKKYVWPPSCVPPVFTPHLPSSSSASCTFLLAQFPPTSPDSVLGICFPVEKYRKLK